MSFLRTGLYIGLLILVPLYAVDFQRDVRPVLAAHCFKCHGPDESKRKAKLRLDVRPEADLFAEILDVQYFSGKTDYFHQLWTNLKNH